MKVGIITVDIGIHDVGIHVTGTHDVATVVTATSFNNIAGMPIGDVNDFTVVDEIWVDVALPDEDVVDIGIGV